MRKIILIAILAVFMVFVAACGDTNGGGNGQEQQVETPTPEPSPPQEPETPAEPDEPEEPEEPAEPDEPPVPVIERFPVAPGFQRVGSEDHGFVDVPDTWTDHGIDGDTARMSHGDNTITLQFADSADQISRYDFINDIFMTMLDMGAEEPGAIVHILNGIDTVMLSAYFASTDSYMLYFAFNSGPNRVNQIILESPANSIDDLFDYLEASFAMIP